MLYLFMEYFKIFSTSNYVTIFLGIQKLKFFNFLKYTKLCPVTNKNLIKTNIQAFNKNTFVDPDKQKKKMFKKSTF